MATPFIEGRGSVFEKSRDLQRSLSSFFWELERNVLPCLWGGPRHFRKMFFENGRRYLSSVDTKAKAHVLALFENQSLQIGKHVIFRDEAIDFFVRGIVEGPEGESPDRVASDIGEGRGF